MAKTVEVGLFMVCPEKTVAVQVVRSPSPIGFKNLPNNNSGMNLATWNVNSLTVRLPQLLDWLAANPVDALVLQETKMTDDKFPHAALLAAGYQSAWFGQKTYNGVALLTRESASDVVKNIAGFDDDQARVIAGTVPHATLGSVRVVGGYFPNGQAPESDKFVYKMAWLNALHAWLKDDMQRHPNVVLMGDFNIAPTDADVYDPIGMKDQIHCTVQERDHFQGLLNLGLVDAFRLFEQPPKPWSWWDYRNLAFRKNQGLRIDHILVSEALKPHVSACVIDKAPRKNERPSDHVPVVITLA
jgi:exodeoxyribonuclease-3